MIDKPFLDIPSGVLRPLDEIILQVCTEHNVTRDALLSRKRFAEVVRARDHLCALCIESGRGYSETARALGIDRSTVATSVERYKGKAKYENA